LPAASEAGDAELEAAAGQALPSEGSSGELEEEEGGGTLSPRSHSGDNELAESEGSVSSRYVTWLTVDEGCWRSWGLFHLRGSHATITGWYVRACLSSCRCAEKRFAHSVDGRSSNLHIETCEGIQKSWMPLLRARCSVADLYAAVRQRYLYCTTASHMILSGNAHAQSGICPGRMASVVTPREPERREWRGRPSSGSEASAESVGSRTPRLTPAGGSPPQRGPAHLQARDGHPPALHEDEADSGDEGESSLRPPAPDAVDEEEVCRFGGRWPLSFRFLRLLL
jgi:hypothetical protein